MPALASLLGLPLAPVISPLLLSTRFAKDELRVATAAFHRARGYQLALDFARFRESVLQEAFVAMPLLLMERIFVVWSYLQEESGHMSLKEFLVGVMIVAKGTRDEQLRFVFQLMDTSGSQELSKIDTLAFLAAVACSNDKIVAVEDEAEKTNSTSKISKKKQWTVDAFADFLHPRTATALGFELLTPAKFIKVLASKKFSLLYLLDWIPVFAAQFQDGVAGTQNSTPCTSPVNRDFKKIQQQSPLSAVRRDLKTSDDQETPSVISPLELSPTLLDVIRAECVSILDYLVNTGEAFTVDTFQQRFSGILPHQALQTVRQVEAMYPAAASMSNPSGASNACGSESGSGRKRFKHLMLILLSAFAKSAEDVVRLLFSIFDDSSKGSLDVLQFAAFLRFASVVTHAESERMAFSTIGYLNNLISSPPASPSGGPSSLSQCFQDESTAPSVSFATFADFFKSAAYREVELLSCPELEVLHLIFHLQLSSLSLALRYANAANDSRSAAIERNGLKQFTKQLRLAKQNKEPKASEHSWFCLMERSKWNAIIEIVCDDNGEGDDNGDIDDAHDALANDIGVSFAEKKDDTDANEKDELVLIPITLWIMLSFWQHNKFRQLKTPQKKSDTTSNWREWTTCVNFSSAPSTSDYQLKFQGFCVTVSLMLATLDGAEEMQSSRPQTIVSESCSIRDLLEAAQLQSNGDRRRTSVRECQLVLTDSQTTRERLTLSIPEEFLKTPLNVLMATILAQDVRFESFRYFELQVSAVEISCCGNDETKQQYKRDLQYSSVAKEKIRSPSSSQLRRSTRLNASTGLSSVHGLANLGNTCFMNSALQCIVVTPLLREYFLHQEYLYDMGTRYTSSGQESPKNSSSQVFGASPSSSNSPKRGKKKNESLLPSSCFLPLAFGQLVAEMNAFSSTGTISGVCDVISPEKMRNTIAILFPHLSDGSQQDAQEFLSSLLSSLGEELRRQPAQKPKAFTEESSNSSATSTLSPQSRAFLSRLPSFSRSQLESSGREAMETDPQSQLRFQVSDSDGRPDSTVANEWWISHLISEPSIFTALFCGQFKSVLSCTACGTKSARFEPFSSLQLPIVDEDGSNSKTSNHSRQILDVIVIAHFAQPSAHAGTRSLRLAVQVGEDWTIDQLLMKLRQDYDAYSLDNKRHYMACVVDGCRIQEYIDRDTLLMTIPSALDVFELENVEDERVESSQTLLGREFHSGDELLVWTPDDRFVKGAVTSVRRSSPRSVATSDRLLSSHSFLSPSPPSYDVILTEGLLSGKIMRTVSRVQPVSSSMGANNSNNRILFFRFVHRRQMFVPFYCKTPHRLALCGFPSVHRAHAWSITGKFLYRIVQERFLPQFATRTFKSNSASSHITNTLVIRRVRADGKCCSRCHWTAQCIGCIIPRSNEVTEDLAMDETFAIDWNLEPFTNGSTDTENERHRVGKDEIEWLLTQGMLSIKDDASYVSYRQTSAHSLERSLKILCNSETLEANCSKCQSRHEGQRDEAAGSDDEEKKSLAQERASLVSLHTKELSLWSVPPILIIQLKRFELGAGSYSWEKVNHCVDFPTENLDLAAFLGVEEESHSQQFSAQESNAESVKRAAAFLHKELNFPLDTASRDCTSYSLYGIVNHMGDIGSGHYTAHIKHPESDDWWLADDSVGLPVNIQKLTPSSAAYLLFYVRHDLLPPSSGSFEAVNGTGSSAAISHERKRLSSFFPRQKHAVKLSDAAVQSAWQNETWLGAKVRSGSSSSPSSGGGDKTDKCNFM